MLFKKKHVELTEEQKEEIRIKDFFDRILPSTIKFYTDHYIIGDSYRCVWAIKEYPPTTEELALFSQLADRNNVTVRLYSRLVDGLEQRKIIQNAARRNKLHTGSDDTLENITAEGNLKDVATLITDLRKNREPLLHCAVFLELKAESMQKLKELQADIIMELTRSKMTVDRLTLRQKEAFFLPYLWAAICSENSLRECSLQALLQIYIRLTIQVKPIRKAFLSGEINTVLTSLLILKDEQKTRQMLTVLFSVTPVKASHSCSSSFLQTFESQERG